MDETQTHEAKVGDLAKVIAAPGHSTDMVVEVIDIDGREMWAAICNGDFLHTPERYTLRRNGNWALKGSGQWSNYLRFEDAA